MGQKTKEWVHILLDRSGSMDEYWEEVIDLLNEEVERGREMLKRKDPPDVELSVTPFSDGCGPTVTYASIADAPVFSGTEWETDGLTRFYDAMGETLKALVERWKRESEDHRILVNLVVLTAGGDNSSRSYTLADIRALLCWLSYHGDWSIRFPIEDLDWMEAQAILALRQEQTGPCEEEGFREKLLSLLFDRKASVDAP